MFRLTPHVLTLLVAFTGLTSAQLLPGAIGADSLSGNCSSAATALKDSAFGQCSLIGSLPYEKVESESVVDSVNDWLEQVCTRESCSSDSTKEAKKLLDDGCQQTEDQIAWANVTRTWIDDFNDNKQPLCLRSREGEHDYCVTTFFKSWESSLDATLTLKSLSRPDFSSLSKNDLCTECNSAFVYLLQSPQRIYLNDTEIAEIRSQCGDDFAKEFTTDHVYIQGPAASGSNGTTGSGGDSGSGSGSGVGALQVGLKTLGAGVAAGVVGIAILA